MSTTPFTARFSFFCRHLLFLVSLALVTCGCATFTPENTDSELVVGVEKSNLPFFAGSSKFPDGLEAELATKLAETLGQTVRFKTMKAADLPSAVDAGDVDIIMSGMVVTRDSSEHVSFSKPYLQTGQTLVVRDGDVDAFTPATDIRGGSHTIGVVRGSLAESYARAYCPASVIVDVLSPEKALSKLTKRAVDVVVMDALRASVMCESVHGVTVVLEPLTTTHVAWAVDPVNFALLDSVNAAREAWMADGTLDAVIGKWIPRYGEFNFDK